jgi:hypothetical protein
VNSGSDVLPLQDDTNAQRIPQVVVNQMSSIAVAAGAESNATLGTGSPAQARAPHALDALSSAMSADPASKSQNKLNNSPDSSADEPAPGPFNLGEVVRGLFEVFQRTGSPSSNRRSAEESTVLLDQSDSDDTRHSSDLEDESTSFTEQSVDDELSTRWRPS